MFHVCVCVWCSVCDLFDVCVSGVYFSVCDGFDVFVLCFVV